ncbi:MAG: single-stranded DNA-binding protein [Balneolaceae bacterium]|jgi:single-strand DNA-binding protein|nr:MAG: single-stranded DNA-binding protein [Balneolaceae bacterium]
MASLNKVMIIGHLGADPDVRYSQNNTAIATLSVATNERYKDQNGDWQESTEWHRIVAFGRIAEVCQEYVKKGSKIYVEGSLQTRSWEDKDGVKKYTTEIKARTLFMLDGKGDSNTMEPAASGAAVVNDNTDNDDLPF